MPSFCLLELLSLLTLSHPEALHWWVKSSGVRQSKITKGTVLASLGKGKVKEEDGQIGPVNPFQPRGFPLMSKIVLALDRVK